MDQKMTEKKRFEMAKPHNMVLMKWPKNITPVQIKAVHLVTVKLKQWIMNNDFKPDFSKDDPISAYDGIKTSFDMSLDEFASALNVSKKALMAIVKDKDGEKVMMRGINKDKPKRVIQEHFSAIRNIECMVDNSNIITAEEGLRLLPNPSYDIETGRVRLDTTQTVAAVLQDEAFNGNRSFVDMQLFMSLNSVMANHIFDRISRFKTKPEKGPFSCTVGSLIEQCGIDPKSLKSRDSFINTNLRRPLKHIAEKSDGVWELIGSGVNVTAKKRGQLQESDVITFKMKYNAPKSAEIKNPDETAASALLKAVGIIKAVIGGDDDSVNHEDFTIEVLGQVMGMAKDAVSGDETMEKTFKIAKLDPVDVMPLCAQGMIIAMGKGNPDSVTIQKPSSLEK